MKDHFFFSHHDDLDQMVRMGIESYEKTGYLVISGPSGSGKSDLADKIHKLTRDRAGSYLAQDASGLADSRFESQLFGHARGAFSSAMTAHAGLLDVVGQGSLCIESLEDLSLENQARMLRFLESKHFRPVGANLEREFHGGLIFTSQNPPGTLADEGVLRRDFYYRIAHYEIRLPSIELRPLDFESIFHLLVNRIRKEINIPLRIPSDVEMEYLKGKPIEGNYHGLRNMLQQSMIRGHPLPDVNPFHRPREVHLELPDTGSLKQDLHILEGQLLKRALSLHPQSRKALAKHLGVSLRSLMYKLKEHGLS